MLGMCKVLRITTIRRTLVVTLCQHSSGRHEATLFCYLCPQAYVLRERPATSQVYCKSDVVVFSSLFLD